MNSFKVKMKYLFYPESLALIGASKNLSKWGFIILHNLLTGRYQGKIYPINPKEKEILGLRCYPSILEVPEPVDLAVITIPARGVPGVMEECVRKKVKAIVVISAGFAELGEEGEELQRKIRELSLKANIPVIGPNGQGISCPEHNLHCWMPTYFPKPGKIGIISQSGNLLTWLAQGLDYYGFGISKGVSAGNMAVLNWSDYLWHFAKDPQTKVILLYIEGIPEGRSFIESAYETSLKKPIVVLKTGRTQAGVRAARSHTGAMAGEDKIFQAICNQTGMIRVETMEEAIVISAGLVATPAPGGRRVGILTGGGGMGVMSADYCLEHSLEVAELSPSTLEKLKKMLPPWWVPGNPVDLVAGIGYASPRQVMPILIESGDIDSLLLIGVGWAHSIPDLAKISPLKEVLDLEKFDQQRKEADLKYCRIIREMIQEYNFPILPVSTVIQQAFIRNLKSLKELLLSEVMVYPNIELAIRSLKSITEYHLWRRARAG